MKHEIHRPFSGKLRGLFCLGLTAALAVGIVLNTAAANTEPPRYDVSVWSSSTHTAALSGGDLYFWGVNDDGQFPESELTYSPEPVQLLSNVAGAAVSPGRTLTVSKNGELRVYGTEPAGEKGSREDGRLLAKDAVQAAASETFAAYVSKTGALYTWGQNDSGQLGNGTTEDSATPVQIMESGVKKVSLGKNFGLALMEDGSVYGWGSDSLFEIGYEEDGKSVEKVTEPVQVAENAADIAAGSSHSCVLKKDGSLWTCGDNTYSQTGVGGGTAVNGLTQILTGIRSVSAGSQHNFAVSNDGAVYAWGYGISGQLGSGSSQRADTPMETNFDYVQVFACSDNTFGVAPDGSVYSFGNNTNYLLGKTTGSDSLIPARILDKDMNWVYEESLHSHDHEHAAEGTASTPPAKNSGEGDTVSGPPVEDVTEPEIVSTPFVSGYGDGSFRPGRNVTRAEFLRMLVSALCTDFDPAADYGTCSFSDIPLGKWYESYVAYAEREELVHGYSDGTFHPDEPITRAEASVMVASALKLNLESSADPGFTDLETGNNATPYIIALTDNGILHGYSDGTFRPRNNISRSESVTMISIAAGFAPDSEEIAALKAEFGTSPFADVPVSEWYYAYLLRAVGYVK